MDLDPGFRSAIEAADDIWSGLETAMWLGRGLRLGMNINITAMDRCNMSEAPF